MNSGGSGLVDVDLNDLMEEFDMKDADAFYEAIGCGDITIGRSSAGFLKLEKERSEDILAPHPATQPKISSDTVTVLGLKGLLTTIARCCNPLPGDEIIGYITRGRGATIHRQDCPIFCGYAKKKKTPEGIVGEPKRTYPVSVRVKAYDRDGLARDVSN